MPAKLSRHAQRRCKGRLGLSARAAHRTAAKAWDKGIRPEETVGELNRWLDSKLDAQSNLHLRIHGDHLYLFAPDQTLITVYAIPHHHRRQIQQIKHRR
jgi:hypothetical protein